MTARVEWHGDEWMRTDLVPAVELGLQRAGIVLQGEMIRRMGSEGGGVKRRTKKGRNVYRAAPPGAFPGVRTGLLRRSITSRLSGDLDGRAVRIRAARVGTNVFYGRLLERGTSRMAARPWAMKSVGLARDKLNREFTRVVSQSLAARAARRAG